MDYRALAPAILFGIASVPGGTVHTPRPAFPSLLEGGGKFLNISAGRPWPPTMGMPDRN